MRCTECGKAMTTRRENYRYLECGLRYVTLQGIDVSRCPNCGNYEISIPRIEELHRLIAINTKTAKETKLGVMLEDEEWAVVAA